MKRLTLLVLCLQAVTAIAQNVFPASGNVGIGTTSPITQFQVNSHRPVIIKSNGTLGVYGSEIGFNTMLNTTITPNEITKFGGTSQNGGANIAVDYSGNMRFQMLTGGSESAYTTTYTPQVTFLNNGNVGIGTTAPGATLHLNTSTSTTLQVQSTSATGYAGLNMVNDSGAPGASLLSYGSTYSGGTYDRANGASLHTTTNSGASAGLSIAARHTSGYITFHSGGPTERMRIAANGNVGIGLGTPQKKVDVFSGYNDFISVGATLGLGQFTGIHFGYLSETHANYRKSALVFERIDQHANGKIHLLNGNTGSASATLADARLTIDQNGNVGIGTVNPDELLSVDGTVHAEEVVVDLLVPGPDYVFDKDYELRSLEQIQSYITANNHLPEVPSAKEMEEKGINLGEMNMLLLKKVEELTLYLIQQQAEIEELKNKIK
jgi:hypothetical protein